MALGRTLLNIWLLPRLSADAQPASQPLLSIVIPARNESHIIEQTVRAFLAQDYAPLEVIVVNDRSTDETGSILHGISDSRLTVIDGQEPPAGWLGKPWALELGSRSARGEILLFVDADVIFAPSAVRAAVAQLLSRRASLIAILPHYEMRGFGEHVGMGMMAFATALIPAWFSNRWQIAALAIGGGSGNMVHRAAFDSAGAFDALRDAVVDDVALAQLVRRTGGRTLLVRGEELVRVHMYNGARGVVQGFTKNLFSITGRNYAIAAAIFVLLILCHLFPYVYVFTGDLFALATVVLISVTRVVAFRSGGYSLANAVFLHPLTMALWAYIFLRSVWITGIRRQLPWRGRVYDATQTRFGGR